jgi:hypothetical protein
MNKSSNKETINTIKQIIKIRAKELILSAIIPIIVFTIGHAMLRLILHFDNADDLTSFELGTVLTAFAIVLLTIVLGAINYSEHIKYAVSMGKRRRDCIISNITLSFIKGILASSLLFLFHTFEIYVLNSTYSHIPVEADFSPYFTPQLFLALILIVMAVENFMGAFAARFGLKVFWMIYTILMFTYITIQNFIISASEGTATGIRKNIGEFFINIFSGITFNTITMILCCVSLVFISLPFLLLRKYRVDM